MFHSWLSATCTLWAVLSTVWHTSAFFLPPGGFYQSSSPLFPRYATRLRSPHTEVTSLQSRPNIPLAFRQPGQTSVPSTRSTQNAFTRSTLPLRQPFSPWRGKRGFDVPAAMFEDKREFSALRGKRGFEVPAVMFEDKREFSSWRGKRGNDVPAVMFEDKREFSSWRGKRSVPSMGLDGHRTRENTVVIQSPAAKEHLMKSLQVHSTDQTAAERTGLQQSLLPSTDLQEYQTHPRSKRSPQKESSDIMPQVSMKNQGLKSSSHISNLPSAKEQAEKQDRAGLATHDENTGTVYTKAGHLTEEVTTVPGTDIQQSASATQKVQEPPTLDGEKPVRSRHGKSTSMNEGTPQIPAASMTPDSVEPYSDEGWIDWDEDLAESLNSGNQQHPQFPGVHQHTPDMTGLHGDPDFPTRVYDLSQPGVGPFFWVEELPDGDSFSDSPGETELTDHLFVQNEGVNHEEDQRQMKPHKLHTSDDEVGAKFQDEIQHLLPITHVPDWTTLQNMKQRSKPQFSKEKMDSKFQKGMHHRQDLSFQVPLSKSAVPQDQRTMRFWKPVFRSQFPSLQTHHLPLSMAPSLHASTDSQTSHAEHLPDPDSSPVQDSPTFPSVHEPPPMPSVHGSLTLQSAGLPSLPDLSLPQPQEMSLHSHGQASVPSEGLHKVGNRSQSGHQFPDTSNAELPNRSQSADEGDSGIETEELKFEGTHSEVTVDGQDPVFSNGNTLKHALESIRDLTRAVSLADLGAGREVAFPGGAGLIGSHADVVEDTPDGKRVTKYQELAVLSSGGGITFTADTKGHVSITVDDVHETADNNDTPNASVYHKNNVNNYTHVQYKQNPLLFSSYHVDVNSTDLNPIHGKSDTRASNQNSSDADVSPVSAYALFKWRLNSHNSDKTNKSHSRTTGQNQPHTNVSGHINARHFNKLRPDSRKKANNNSNIFDQIFQTLHSSISHNAYSHEDSSVSSQSSKPNSEGLNPYNPILNPSKALRPLIFQTLPFHIQSDNPFLNTPREKMSVKGQIPSSPKSGQGSPVLRRRRRAAVSENASSIPTTSAHMAQIQARLVKNDLAKQTFSDIKINKNNTVLSNQGKEHIQMTQTTAKPTQLKGHEQTDIAVSSKETKQTGAINKRGHLNKEDHSYQPAYKPGILPQKTKKFLTRGNEQIAMKQTKQFYSNYFPSSYRQKANRNPPHIFIESLRSSERHGSPKPQWSRPDSKQYPLSEPYIFHSGRTFKPNWYFMSGKPLKPSSVNKLPTFSTKQHPEQKNGPHTKQSVTRQQINRTAINTPINTATSTRNPFTRITGLKNGKGLTNYTERLLRNLNHLFKISFDIQFHRLKPKRSSPNGSQPQTATLRQPRFRKFWPRADYNAYVLFPLGNIAWANFLYYKRPPPPHKPHTAVAHYKLG